MRFVCEDVEIESPFAGRDQPHYKGDVVELFLDPVGDGRNYVELQVSPNNQIFDQQISLDAAPRSDANGRLRNVFLKKHFHPHPEWDMPGLRTATRRVPGGWIAELAVPAAAFGRSSWRPMTLCAHLMRYDWQHSSSGKRRLIAMNWAPVRYGCPHISPAAMGRLVLLPKK